MGKVLKIFVWVFLFPFMLTYWGYKKQNKIALRIGGVLSLLIIIGAIFSEKEPTTAANDVVQEITQDKDVEKEEETSSQIDNSNDYKVVIKTPIDINEDMLKEATGLTSEELELLLTLAEKNELDTITDIQDGIGDSVDTLKSFRVWFGEEQALVTFDKRELYYFGIYDKVFYEVETTTTTYTPPKEESSATVSQFEGYALIEVDGGDLSGFRQPNVVVDIGFGDREYWAFTNEYGQLVRVIADEVILQDESTEPVNLKGRYYPDEAKVPGTESSTLDEGHVIADSLGGVANAYNITPQNSTLNRHGDQAYMEKIIRDVGGCTDFEAIITYTNTDTQIPSSYKFTYTINGNVIVDEFANVNPDEVNQSTSDENTSSTEETTEEEAVEEVISETLKITMVDKHDEEVTIKNVSSSTINLQGYILVSVKGNQTFTFPSYELKPNGTVTVYGKGGTGELQGWAGNVWNNSSSDPAELYDNNGNLLDRVE